VSVSIRELAARESDKRARFGRKSSVTLRSLYPIVLGLGGWFAALLIVITTMPTVPLSDPLLAALSIGLPVGLCVYFAWTNRDWSATDLTRLFTAVVGSVVGANLLVLDIAWDLRGRDRVAPANANEALPPRPSTG